MPRFSFLNRTVDPYVSALGRMLLLFYGTNQKFRRVDLVGWNGESDATLPNQRKYLVARIYDLPLQGL